MVNLRLATEEDKKLICKWYEEWGCGVPNIEFMPPTTFIALDGEMPVASAALILTNAPHVAMIENVIKSPAFKAVGREALKPLFSFIGEYAKQFHVKHLFIAAILEQVKDRYVEYGFKLKSANLGYFYKTIGV